MQWLHTDTIVTDFQVLSIGPSVFCCLKLFVISIFKHVWLLKRFLEDTLLIKNAEKQTNLNTYFAT